MPSEIFFDLVVPRHRLANFCFGILIPIMLSAMSDKNCTLVFDSLEPARVVSRQLKLGVLANVRDCSRRQIFVKIEQMLLQILKRSSLRHVIGILVQISEPHLCILPIRKSERCHVSNGSYTKVTGQFEESIGRPISSFNPATSSSR
jgi:hypothetical protein